MQIRLLIAWLGNLIDIVATLYLCGNGYLEVNPFMAWLLQWPWTFVLVKLQIMSAITIYLRVSTPTKYAVIASWFSAILYGTIAFYYLCLLAFWI